MPPLVLYAVYVCLIIVLGILIEISRGTPLSKKDSILSSVGTWIGALADVFFILSLIGQGTLAFYLPYISEIPLQLSLAIIFILTAFVIVSCLRGHKKQYRLDPNFNHLRIHYSQTKDNPDIENPGTRYVENTETHQAYLLSNILDEPIRDHKIQHCSKGSEPEIKNYFTDNEVKPPLKYANYDDLGLWVLPSNVLVKKENMLDNTLLNNLKKLNSDNRIFDRYIIWFLYPKPKVIYWLFRSMAKHDWANSNKILLDKKSEPKQIYEAPYETIQLIFEHIVDEHHKFFSIPVFRIYQLEKIKKFHFNEGHYFTAKTLLLEAEKMDHPQ